MTQTHSTELFKPNRAFAKTARIKNLCEYEDLRLDAEEDFEGFWGKLAKEKIDWMEPFSKVLDESEAPFYKWFVGGKLNVCAQCLDRHLDTRKNKAAIIFEGELGDSRIITYRELFYEVKRTANLLKNKFNVKKGDRVVIYMPMIPEAAFMMLACARIGAIHSVVFGGFSAEALRDRIIDAEAKLVITADGAYRRGKPYMLKPVVDDALAEGACPSIEKVLIVIRNKEEINYVPGRDYIYNEMIGLESAHCPPEPMDAEDPLFLLYTSGSTGKPKGVQHNQAGYILWAQTTMEWVFDVKENDTYWCTADVGWITGHTYIVYGPLAMGATTVMYEGVPIYPDTGRWWKMIEHYRVNQFYTAPTAIRLLHKEGKEEPKKYNLSNLKVLGTVGEPINPDAWNWYYNEIGGGQCPIVDTWWQTETGGHMISPLPGATPIKPGCATLPLPGIFAEVIDEEGNPKPAGEQGYLCITKPWPSMIRNIWGDPKRYESSYFSTCKKNGKPVYFAGDGAIRDERGYITITGRMDDVINVSGHRLGTAEIESAIAKHPGVAETAVVSRLDEIKGESVYAFIVLKPGYEDNVAEELQLLKEINAVITREIGPLAKADTMLFVPGLPKTRSGKIMRRILRSIARGEEITQDTSTLEDPAIVQKIQQLA
ncbi:acetate--CoA ligase [Wolinella succinogenes]|uniref:Acetyl-coenzyme A synthetase n=1 Tax=Wolinella succinogenes (strain ATCC 29543 / DSM 1740 / CCUG 13145 / JCM 31913 / LMG 7466 / NCTC 11488 / FDC 602W) TaxID=273121 RepID=ACSA_WOLSU|nr:acetate--CoA ligase [Wolinella succinogenes]Q7M9Y2.1 RecName: Full=Acetyl-coenzyme A synthetase; Short=AcCoA synthetase; Short=Acs; AltName: Full=Acetate--CoA ligase; AltName: Full=Acyl-activating enzyme [Wolinella succinogenes DSM 1740]CAE09727.1 ACETYL-COENZYME A SYNTHETASE [Wolinella succinogenes]VEG81942.1 Acetyl-coenzyme A synthetase [Wolinella succinogenes]HCZ19348.1 acetyl-coenzyme A synthetase [Helicobacter sp.]